MKHKNMLEADQTWYMEKHRVYEMFRNIVKALIVCQPSDPLRFIAWHLKHKRFTDVPKIILVAPPQYTDRVYVALDVAKSTGAVTIDRQNVLRRHWRKRGERSADFITMLIEYIKAKGASKKGWILLDIPKNKDESDKMISLGILPTHTIVLNTLDTLNDNQIKNDKCTKQYKNLEFEIKMRFRFTLKEICVYNKSIDTVSELCLEQILFQKPSTVPFTPRVTVIGPKGSKCFVTANEISKKLNIVHVDFDQIQVQKKINDASKIPQETINAWLKEKLMDNDCMEKGYVLTGFPRTRSDLEWLDSIEVAPNRVIFLAVDIAEIYLRLRSRCINKKLGTFMSLEEAVKELKSGNLKFEDIGRYEMDLGKLYCDYKAYCDNLKDMLYYSGNNCTIITVDQSRNDKILECVMSGSPAAGPRPQNCKPSRLTEGLNKIMLLSYENICQKTCLSEEAQHLLNDLDQDTK